MRPAGGMSGSTLKSAGSPKDAREPSIRAQSPPLANVDGRAGRDSNTDVRKDV
jgi:hypothetical protein